MKIDGPLSFYLQTIFQKNPYDVYEIHDNESNKKEYLETLL